MEEMVLICEDSLEGVFTAIYQVYAGHLQEKPVRIQTCEDENYKLFVQYIHVDTDVTKAVKVMRTLRQRFGEDVYKDLCMALAAEDIDKAQAVYRTVAWGLKHTQEGRKGRIMDHLADPYVRKVMELSRRANNELLHMRGFLRFQELEQGMLLARIGPRDNILAMLAPHFADRLSGENFMIYDDKRNVVVVHPAGEEWYMVSDVEKIMEELEGRYSTQEKTYQELFHYFCHKISITERENLDLQRNMLPLRFRKYMVEFM